MAIPTNKNGLYQPQQGTRTDIGTQAFNEGMAKEEAIQNKKSKKQQCEENGGFWDEPTQSCVTMKPTQPQKTPQEQVKQNVANEGGYIDETGKYVPSTKPSTKIDFKKDGTIDYTPIGGETLTLSREEFNALQGNPGKVTKNVKEIQAVESGAIQQVQRQQALSNLGLSQQQISAVQSGLVEAPIDWGQAGTAGVARVLPMIAGGAAGGAAIGAVAGGVGAVPGAIIGGVGGLISGLTSGILANIKQQQKGEINVADQVLTRARTNMRQLSTLAAKDPGNAAIYVEAYNRQLAQVYQAQAKIKLETSGNLNKFMEDGTDILSDFELFLQPNGQAQIYRRQLELALMSGVAPSLTVDDFAE